MNFSGYRRPDGGWGVRNHVLVIPSVGCSQVCSASIARGLHDVVFLPNIFGCGQIGEDRQTVKRTLVGFGLNPNVASVLVVGNGCEALTAEEVAGAIAESGKRVEAIVIQESPGIRKTVALGRKIVKEMLADAARLTREPVSLAELILGVECGGSDYTSGLASNPAVGVASDMLVAEGGTVILSETPEIIGAEHLLAKRARSDDVARRIVEASEWWERAAVAGGQDIRQGNPSPGNIEGGITTLEEKSLGCIHKAGKGPVEEYIAYACRPGKKGLVYMDTPAHDIEQLTGMVAGGAQVVVFTTGRGTAVGSPIAPVIKITANRRTFLNMRDSIDMDVSKVLEGKDPVSEAGRRIFAEIAMAASGKPTKAEKLGQRDFAMFKMYPDI